MAESASVPLQLQSVALRRGGFKRFVKAREEVIEEEKNEVTEINGDAVKQIYEEIIAAPKTPTKRTVNCSKAGSVIKEEVIALSDSDEDLEMVDTSANKELLAAVQQVRLAVFDFPFSMLHGMIFQGDLYKAKRVRFCDYNCTDSFGWTPLEIAAVLGYAPLVR